MNMLGINDKQEIKIELPSLKIELDLSQPYKDNKLLLDKATIEYVESLLKYNKERSITKKYILNKIQIPLMTFSNLRKRLFK